MYKKIAFVRLLTKGKQKYYNISNYSNTSKVLITTKNFFNKENTFSERKILVIKTN